MLVWQELGSTCDRGRAVVRGGDADLGEGDGDDGARRCCRRGGVHLIPCDDRRRQWQHGRTTDHPRDVAGVADAPR